MVGAVGTFNALTLSFSRLPLVLAEDGFLPRIFLKRFPKTDAPWVAIVVCTLFWTLALNCSFIKLIVLDVLLSGLSVLLEFVALVALRIKEPTLTRPYRVPGGLAGAIFIGLPPLALMVITIVRNHDETIGSLNALTFGGMLVASGAIVYGLCRLRKRL
jgi:amino acid transporter